MDIKKFKQFLGNFTLSQEDIITYLKNKKIIEKNNNLFLVDEQDAFKSNQVFQNNLIFIKLQNKLLPSMYLLEYLKTHTKPIRLKSDKQALNFTYGKSLHIDSIIRRRDFVEKKHYVLTSNDEILGVVELDQTQRFACQNIMNIGEYLREN